MRITVTKKHIKAAQLSQNNLSPVEIAVMELDCFEEIRLIQMENDQYLLDLDGTQVVMPQSVNRALWRFETEGIMRTLDIDLPMEEEVMDFLDQDLLLGEGLEDSMDLGSYGYGY